MCLRELFGLMVIYRPAPGTWVRPARVGTLVGSVASLSRLPDLDVLGLSSHNPVRTQIALLPACRMSWMCALAALATTSSVRQLGLTHPLGWLKRQLCVLGPLSLVPCPVVVAEARCQFMFGGASCISLLSTSVLAAICHQAAASMFTTRHHGLCMSGAATWQAGLTASWQMT